MATVERAVHETVDELMYEHRAAWAAAAVGAGAVDLGAEEDPVAALAGAEAAVWLDGYERTAREALVAAAARGARLVVAVPAHTTDGDDLARALGDAEVVPQFPAGGSLIGSGASAQAEAVEPAAPEHAAWLLVCANVETAQAQARVGVHAGGLLAAHVARLEEALAALREANVRLAREHLGRHDASAGTIVGRAEQRVQAAEANAAEWQRRFEEERALAFRHHEWFMAARAKLDEPHHRAAERLYPVVRRIPGLRPLVRRLRRRR